MIAAKHQQQQHPNETPFTSSDEFDFLTNATTLEEEEGDNRHPRQHCCYSPTTSIHNTFKIQDAKTMIDDDDDDNGDEDDADGGRD
ncbi:unnamed protein product [Trichobilharzia regenti]|nr:unnamed protein product [Trichobilharzia regenti]